MHPEHDDLPPRGFRGGWLLAEARNGARALLAQPFMKPVDPFLRARKRTGKQQSVVDEMVIVNDEGGDIEVTRRRRKLRHVQLVIQLRSNLLDRDAGRG